MTNRFVTSDIEGMRVVDWVKGSNEKKGRVNVLNIFGISKLTLKIFLTYTFYC